MKIGIFTDSHYSSRELSCGCRYNSLSLRKIKEAYSRFESEGCELIICLGDLIDTEATVEMEKENLRQIARVINASPIRTVCLMGNHDAFVLRAEEFYGILGLSEPNDMHLGEKSLIFLDACYFKSGKHYAPGDSDWTDTYLPGEEELRKRLAEAKGDTYIFIHQNIDSTVPNDHRLYNADRLIEIIGQCKKVKAVFQGHYHKGSDATLSGVRYITLPAMCEGEDRYLIKEI